ncbi:MAG: DnaJ domain-containing protein [Bacteroidota bacterium]|jgi:hypothetical protein
MSYSQILRRLNRLIKSTINDTLDNLSKRDKDDLDDFDRDLRGEKRASDGASGGQRTSDSESSGAQRPSGSSSQGQSGQSQARQGQSGGSANAGQSAHKEGKRKPGEKDDAYYYGVLGLTTSATEAEIKKAYRKLMSQYHPDRVASLGEDLQRAAGEKAKSINEAYHIIERRMGFK